MKNIQTCPICNASSFKEFLKLKDHSVTKEYFTIMRCNLCGFKITSPRPTAEMLPQYYKSEDYISHSDTKKGFINFLYQQVKNLTLYQKEKMISGFNTSKRLLDVGCGTGDFIKYASHKKWEVIGLEPDEGARKLASLKLSGKVFPIQNLFELSFQSFGVITMWHVLEHVSELNRYLNQLNLLLETDGRLVIALPNPESADAKHYGEYWAAYDVPRHLYHFSKNNISDLAAKHNFKIESVKPMMFDSYYVSLLSEKYKGGNIFKAANNGLLSNLKGRKSKNHSSLIYIFSKND